MDIFQLATSVKPMGTAACLHLGIKGSSMDLARIFTDALKQFFESSPQDLGVGNRYFSDHGHWMGALHHKWSP